MLYWVFGFLGIGTPLTKTDKKKCRKQWSLVEKRVATLDSLMSADNIPEWFLYGPYSENIKKEKEVVEKAQEVVSKFKELFHGKDDVSNSEMRRKRKADDEVEINAVAGCRNSVVEILPLLDDEVTAYAKRRKIMSQFAADEDCLIVDKEGTLAATETNLPVQSTNDEDSASTKASVCSLQNACDSSKDSDCEIIDNVKPENDEIDHSFGGDKNSLVDAPSTSKGIFQEKSVAKVNEKTGNSSMSSNMPARPLADFYLCEKLGVCHVPSSNIFELIRQRRRENAEEFKAFDDHIWRHFEMNAQDDHTFTWKMRVREKLLMVVRRLYPEARLIAVGSTINGCGAYNSDMDLCMCLPHPLFGYQTDRQHGVSVLKKVYRELAVRSKGLVRRATLIPAKVPIIKLEMESPFDELEVDINCNNVPGIYNSHLLHYYARTDDRFPALCLLVKHWAINAGINDAMTGTFNSYSLILLVLHFLQCAVFPPVLPNLQALFPDQFNASVDLNKLELFKELSPLPTWKRNDSTVGELLIAFFDYYTNFDFTKNAISIARGCIFPRSSLPLTCLRYKIFIEEPFDLQNTARCVTRVEKLDLIKNAFADARKALLMYKSKGPTLSSINVR